MSEKGEKFRIKLPKNWYRICGRLNARKKLSDRLSQNCDRRRFFIGFSAQLVDSGIESSQAPSFHGGVPMTYSPP